MCGSGSAARRRANVGRFASRFRHMSASSHLPRSHPTAFSTPTPGRCWSRCGTRASSSPRKPSCTTSRCGAPLIWVAFCVDYLPSVWTTCRLCGLPACCVAYLLAVWPTCLLCGLPACCVAYLPAVWPTCHSCFYHHHDTVGSMYGARRWFVKAVSGGDKAGEEPMERGRRADGKGAWRWLAEVRRDRRMGSGGEERGQSQSKEGLSRLFVVFRVCLRGRAAEGRSLAAAYCSTAGMHVWPGVAVQTFGLSCLSAVTYSCIALFSRLTSQQLHRATKSARPQALEVEDAHCIATCAQADIDTFLQDAGVDA
eukprot:366432-Chlamydomonas_euryale.AAC.13